MTVRVLHGIYVLFVDDNADARDIVDLSLEHEGAVVDVAQSAAEALRKLRVVSADVIITDLTMPGMDGYAFLDELKRSPATREIPVIALTGVAGRDVERAGRQAGFAEYLVKPIDPATLAKIVRRVVDDRNRNPE